MHVFVLKKILFVFFNFDLLEKEFDAMKHYTDLSVL